MKPIAAIAISLELLSLLIWITFFAFSLLFLDSPQAKISQLWFIYGPLIITAIIIILTIIFNQKTWVIISGLTIALSISTPIILGGSKYLSDRRVPDEKISFILPQGYNSLQEYLEKNIGKEVIVTGKIFFPENVLPFVRLNTNNEVVIIRFEHLDPESFGNTQTREVEVQGVLNKTDKKWIIDEPKIRSYITK